MGAKCVQPDRLCINWGDAAIGFTGIDFSKNSLDEYVQNIEVPGS